MIHYKAYEKIIHSDDYKFLYRNSNNYFFSDISEIDLDSWEQDEILVNWKVEDPESGVKFCEWAIGKLNIVLKLVGNFIIQFNEFVT